MKLRDRMHQEMSHAIAQVLRVAPLSELLEDVADVLEAGGRGQEVSIELRWRATQLKAEAADATAEHGVPCSEGCDTCDVLVAIGEVRR